MKNSIILSILLLTISCDRVPEIKSGEVNGLSYSNLSLGIAIDLPESWLIIKDEETLKLIDKKASSSKNLKQRWLSLSAKPLVSAYLYKDNDFDKSMDIMINPNITVYIEFIPSRSEVKTAFDYIKYLKKGIQASKQIKYTFMNEVSLDLSGFEFARLDYEFSILGRDIEKRAFLYKLGKYLVNVTITMEKEDKKIEKLLMDSFYSLRFDRKKIK